MGLLHFSITKNTFGYDECYAFVGEIMFVEGKILMFLNRIWGSQAETRQWALEIKPKGFRCCVSLPKQEIKVAPYQENKNNAQ